MIILKYQKKYPASLAGHVDTLRTMTRILRRAKCQVQYSKGFNPHMELLFSPALSLGVESMCEYVALQSNDYNSLNLLNSASPLGITFVRWWDVEQNFNIASAIDSAQYTVSCKQLGDLPYDSIKNSFVMTVPSKNGDQQKDVHDKILNIEVVDCDTVNFTLACGNSNLKSDLFVRALRSQYNVDSDYNIVKHTAYVSGVDADSYLDSISSPLQGTLI